MARPMARAIRPRSTRASGSNPHEAVRRCLTRWSPAMTEPVPPATPPDDAAFLADFEACRIPLAEWNHRSHIRMAYLYLRAHSFDEAVRRIRDGLNSFNS